jgi:hypothetical protein
MALPALNNQNTIANLPIDANSISQSVLDAASRTGRLQIYNNGTIAFNNYVTGGSVPSATKESGGLGYTGISIILEIRNYLESISGNIIRFIETSQRQTEITQNLLEATNARRDIEIQPQQTAKVSSEDKGMDFKKTFEDFFNTMKESFSGLTDKSKGGFFGGILSSLILNIGKFLLKGFGLVLGGYLISKEIGKIPIGEGKTIADKVSELTESAHSSFEKYMSSDKTASSAGNGTGQNAPSAGQNAPSAGQNTPSAGQNAPAGEGTATQTGNDRNNSNIDPRELNEKEPEGSRTETAGELKDGVSGDIATESDLVGLNMPSTKTIKGVTNTAKEARQVTRGLVYKVQQIRRKMGMNSFNITSAYRNKAYNKVCGGVDGSPHTKGKAMDIAFDVRNREATIKFIKIASSLGIQGIGIYENHGFIHVDFGHRSRNTGWGNGNSFRTAPNWVKPYLTAHMSGEYKEGTAEREEKETKTNLTPTTQTQQASTVSSDISSVVSNVAGSITSAFSEEGSIRANLVGMTTPKSDAPQTAEREIPEGMEEEEEEEEGGEEKVVNESSTKLIPKEIKKKETATKDKQSRFTSYRMAVYDAFKSAGFSDMQARALTAEVGRENDYRPENLFGHHKDMTGPTNFGIISFEGSRLVAVKNRLKSKGLLTAKGTAKENQESLNVMASYVMEEMKTTEASHGGKEFLSNPNITQEEAEPVLAKYIRWKYKEKGFPWQKHIARERKHRRTLDRELSTGKPETTTSPEGGQAGKPSFGDEARRVGEAVGETVKEGYEEAGEKVKSMAEMFSELKSFADKNFNPMYTKAKQQGLTLGVNTVQKLLGVDESAMVKIEDGKVVPYKSKETAKGAAKPKEKSIGEKLIDSAKEFFQGSSTGDSIYESSKQTKISEDEVKMQQTKEGQAGQPTIINNTQQAPQQKTTQGLLGVPPVRNNDESAMEKFQYNNMSGTGIC